jgi:hypothetical protein
MASMVLADRCHADSRQGRLALVLPWSCAPASLSLCREEPPPATSAAMNFPLDSAGDMPDEQKAMLGQMLEQMQIRDRCGSGLA